MVPFFDFAVCQRMLDTCQDLPVLLQELDERAVNGGVKLSNYGGIKLTI
jgi:hypothetical protein